MRCTPVRLRSATEQEGGGHALGPTTTNGWPSSVRNLSRNVAWRTNDVGFGRVPVPVIMLVAAYDGAHVDASVVVAATRARVAVPPPNWPGARIV